MTKRASIPNPRRRRIHQFNMAAKRKQTLKFGTLAFRWLCKLQPVTAKGKTMRKERSKSKGMPKPSNEHICMESSLKRCSGISDDKKDTAFNQAENTRKDNLNPTPGSADRRVESSLERCSSLSNDKDTAFNQTENTSNDKLNPTPASAVHRKMGSNKDTGFSQLEKTVRAKSLVGLSRTHVFGCVTPYSRALASRVGKGVLRLPLSEKAKNLVKGGMSVGLAVRMVGFQNAFTSWRDGASIYVYLRAKNGGLAVTKT